jgi:hypothetical protein
MRSSKSHHAPFHLHAEGPDVAQLPLEPIVDVPIIVVRAQGRTRIEASLLGQHVDLRHVHPGLWEGVEGGLETGIIVDDRADPAHRVTVEAVLVATGLAHWQLLAQHDHRVATPAVGRARTPPRRCRSRVQRCHPDPVQVEDCTGKAAACRAST